MCVIDGPIGSLFGVYLFEIEVICLIDTQRNSILQFLEEFGVSFDVLLDVIGTDACI